MAEQNRPDDKNNAPESGSEERMMWIFSGAIVLLILGAMGANMLFHHEKPAAADTDISAQSRSAPAQ
jgi:hypothetical protein